MKTNLTGNHQGWVYIIKGEGNWYKIGSSKYPEKRLKQLQTGNPVKLRIIHKIECFCFPSQKVEKRVRAFFPRIKQRGEWLELSLPYLQLLQEWQTDKDIYCHSRNYN